MGKRIGIIGFPIGHSISPVFQQAALDYCALDATYSAWEVHPELLPEFVAGLRSPDTMGINVTVPHKEAILAHLDHIDDWAHAAGAVNTIVNHNGLLTGYNTDGGGFLKALEEHDHFSSNGRSVLILGAGGAAKGVALALVRRGVARMTIANRTLARAEQLAKLVEDQGLHVEAIPLLDRGQALVDASARCDLLVNCTTMGMKHGPDELGTPLLAQHIPPETLVYDLVYNPPETPLLREATRAGAATLGGLPMLVYQGAASFELWTGRVAPVDIMLRSAEVALR